MARRKGGKKLKYDPDKIMKKVQQKRIEAIPQQLADELDATKKELEVTQMEHKFNQRKLKVHEAREKARADGLKKAKEARKNGKKPSKRK